MAVFGIELNSNGLQKRRRKKATDAHKYRLPLMLGRVNESAHDLVRLFTRHVQLSRPAAPSHGQEHGNGAVNAAVGAHRKAAILTLDRFHAFAK